MKEYTVTRTMAHSMEPDLCVTVHTSEPPTDEDWADYVAGARRLIAQGSAYRVFVWSEGGAPNAKQRRELVDALGGSSARTAIVTASKLMQTVGTAIGWFNRDLQVFGPDQVQQALSYLELSPHEEERVKRMLDRLSAELGLASPYAQASGDQS